MIKKYQNKDLIIKKVIEVDKKNGKTRKIIIPTSYAKERHRNYLPVIEKIFKNEILKYSIHNNVIHGFIKNKNAVSNAEQHIGYEYTLSMDLENFFDTVDFNMVKNYFPLKKTLHNKENYNLTQNKLNYFFFVNNKLPQGFSTSPILSNLAFLKIDNLILEFIKSLNNDVIYTRYADDLTFSFNDKNLILLLKNNIKKIIEENDFKLNTKKTHLYNTKNGNRIITGIAVKEDSINITRKCRKKLRAAIHQKNTSSIEGLQEWSKLKKSKFDI